jgi:putative transposase
LRIGFEEAASPRARTARASVGEICYHVINRGNARQDVFRKKGDYQAFVDLIGRA